MSDIQRLFTTFFDTPTHATAIRRWTPAIDLVERDEDYLVTADLPGLTAEDVSIDVNDGVLTLSGERNRGEVAAKQGGYVRVERATGRFARTLALPKGVDAEAIAAAFDNGVLTITIPKPAEAKPHRVAITAAA